MIPITLHWFSPLSAPPFLMYLIGSVQRLCVHQFGRPGAVFTGYFAQPVVASPLM